MGGGGIPPAPWRGARALCRLGNHARLIQEIDVKGDKRTCGI